ncbi:MAG TPA: TetR/AcrR family transcriptional regulator [Mycobacteriales bacterium]|nr:TetR/AcrR family transcriptional regulator [Mycobacteriales bacterium]
MVTTGPVPGKRERLVHAATELVHRQGVEKTTLADIAEVADVPLGNIYYYFKTKDALVAAVVEAHVRGVLDTIESLGQHRTPKARLKALTRTLAARADLIAKYGCPHGTLCSELDKSEQNHDVARLMNLPLAWLEDQFRTLGHRDARQLALTFLASYQGTAVLTHTTRDPSVLTAEGRRLERWIDSL